MKKGIKGGGEKSTTKPLFKGNHQEEGWLHVANAGTAINGRTLYWDKRGLKGGHLEWGEGGEGRSQHCLMIEGEK